MAAEIAEEPPKDVVPEEEPEEEKFEIIVTKMLKDKCVLAEYFALQFALNETLEKELWVDFEKQTEELIRRFVSQRKKDNWVCRETPRIERFYDFMENISKGEDGSVDIVQHRDTRASFCVRTIYKNCVPKDKKENLFKQILKEIALLYLAKDVPQMVDLFQVYENEDSVQLVTTWCPRGEIESLLLGDGRPVTEKEIQKWFVDMMQALYPFHQIGVAHGDIKAEKFLLKGDIANYFAREYENEIVLSDFSMVKSVYRRNKPFSSTFQDYFFFAPESYRENEYEKPSDMWALGVILYVMKFGYPPFMSYQENKKLFEKEMEKVTTGGFVMDTTYEGKGAWIPKNYYCSAALKNLLQKLFNQDPMARISMDEVFDHPWNLQFAETDDVIFSLVVTCVRWAETPEWARTLVAALNKNEYFGSDDFKMYEEVYQRLNKGDGKIELETWAQWFQNPELAKVMEKKFTDETVKEITSCCQFNRPSGSDIVLADLVMVKYLTSVRSGVVKFAASFAEKDENQKGFLEQLEYMGHMQKCVGVHLPEKDIELFGMQYLVIDEETGEMNVNYSELLAPVLKVTSKYEIDYALNQGKYLAKIAIEVPVEVSQSARSENLSNNGEEPSQVITDN